METKKWYFTTKSTGKVREFKTVIEAINFIIDYFKHYKIYFDEFLGQTCIFVNGVNKTKDTCIGYLGYCLRSEVDYV